MIKLSKRLKIIHDMVPHSAVADIGADHGKLIISLVEDGIASYGFAVENKKGPYEHLLKAIKESNLEDYITASFSDGIEAIPEEITTLILAGMGGTNIIDILKKDQLKLKNIKTIIVDAHSCIPKLRAEISKLGFIISDEKIIKEDNIYYEIIKFIRAGIATYGENDLEFGPILRQEKSATFKEKYSDRIKEIDNLLVNSELPNDRAIELKQEKQRIEGII